MQEVNNGADYLDSRDIIARIDELEGERAAAQDAGEEWPEEDAAELAALKSLAEQCEGYVPDWRYGATLIRDSYFEEYARELAEDIGALENCNHWPATCIDWERATRELQQDYTSVEFDGVTYWVR